MQCHTPMVLESIDGVKYDLFPFYPFKKSKVSPFFQFGIILLICCISIAQNEADLAPIGVSTDLQDGHGHILYVENTIAQVNIICYSCNDYFLAMIILLF